MFLFNGAALLSHSRLSKIQFPCGHGKYLCAQGHRTMFTYVALILRNQPLNTMQETGLHGFPQGTGKVNGPELARRLWNSTRILPGESGALTSHSKPAGNLLCVLGGKSLPYRALSSFICRMKRRKVALQTHGVSALASRSRCGKRPDCGTKSDSSLHCYHWLHFLSN